MSPHSQSRKVGEAVRRCRKVCEYEKVLDKGGRHGNVREKQEGMDRRRKVFGGAGRYKKA